MGRLSFCLDSFLNDLVSPVRAEGEGPLFPENVAEECRNLLGKAGREISFSGKKDTLPARNSEEKERKTIK